MRIRSLYLSSRLPAGLENTALIHAMGLSMICFTVARPVALALHSIGVEMLYANCIMALLLFIAVQTFAEALSYDMLNSRGLALGIAGTFIAGSYLGRVDEQSPEWAIVLFVASFWLTLRTYSSGAIEVRKELQTPESSTS